MSTKYNFFDEVHDFQRFVRENLRLLGNYSIVSEQLYMNNNETGIIDMLVLDHTNKKLVILELKNDTTTDKNIWQPIRYYDLIRRGEEDLQKLLLNICIENNYNVSNIDLTPKVILVVPECNEQLLRTLSYFNDIEIEVVEITKHIIGNREEIKKKTYYPKTIFHKEDLVNIKNKTATNWNFEKYIKHGINKDKIKLAKQITMQLKSLFTTNNQKFDMFFNETKITITKNNKVWGYLFIKQRPLDYKLTFSFKVPKEVEINKIDFMYHQSIESVIFQKSGVKLLLSNLIPVNVIEKYL